MTRRPVDPARRHEAWIEAPASAVFGVVVTYNPDHRLAAHLRALRAQVGALLVVDNASANASIVETTALEADCSVVLNTSNLGVAEALNQGAQAALERGAEWLATFDQDSQVPANAVGRLLAVCATLPWREDVAVLAMSHSDRGTGRDYHRGGEILEQGNGWREVRTTITSGSLVRVSAFRRIGPFDSRLFIDSVDLDYCLRCRQLGWRVVESLEVTLLHSMGDSKRHIVLGREITLTRHSPLRRYYITRNQLEMCRRYILFDPRWVLGALWDLVATSLTVLTFEDDRVVKLRAMIAGACDFARRRFGPRRR